MTPHNQLVLMCGLPMSGKSTALEEYFETTASAGAAIVSPDSIRVALHGQRFVPEAEGVVWALARVMARALYLAGHHTVFVDATNNTLARRDEWRRAIRDLGYPVLVWYIDTPADVCLERARALGDDHIIPVIERMADEHEPPNDELLWP